MSRSSSLLLDALGFRAPEVSQQTADSLLSEQGLETFARNQAPIASQHERDQQKGIEDQNPSVGLWTATATGLPTSYLIRSIERSNTGVVPGYSVSEAELKNAANTNDKRNGLDPRYWSRLLEATSPADLEVLREQAYSMQIAERKIANSGADGSIVQFAAGFVDPLSYAAFTGFGEVAALMGAARLAGRAGAAIRNGLVAGASIGTINSYIATQDPNMTARDILISTTEMMAAGALLSAGLHGTKAETRRRLQVEASAAKRIADSQRYQDLKDASGGKAPDLTDKGKAVHAEDIQNDLDIKAIDDHVAQILAIQDAAEAAKKATAARIASESKLASDIQYEKVRRDMLETNMVRVAAEPFDTALKHLDFADFPADKKLTRSDIDPIVGYAGLKTETQGFPTPEELRGYLMNAREAAMVKAQQAAHAELASLPPIEDLGKPPAAATPETPTGTKQVWEMNPQEHAAHVARREGFATGDVVGHTADGQPVVRAGSGAARTVLNARRSINDGIAAGGKINADLWEAYNAAHADRPIKIPDNYKRIGDYYVPKTETPTATSAAKTEVPPKEPVASGETPVASQTVPPKPTASGDAQVGDKVIVYGQEASVVGHTETGFIEVSFDGGAKEAVSPDQVTIKNPDGTTRNAAQLALRAMGAASPETIDNPQQPPRGSKTASDPDYSNVSNARGFSVKALALLQKIPIIGKLFKAMGDGFGKTDFLVQSKNPTARVLGRTLGEEAAVNRPGEKLTYPTSMRVERDSKTLVQIAEDNTRQHFEDWAREKGGMHPLNRQKYLEDFYTEVAKERRNPSTDTDPSVAKAAKVFTDLYEDGRMRAVRNGLPGFWERTAEGKWKEIPPNEQYVNRVYKNIAEYIDKLGGGAGGAEKLQAFLENALNDHGEGTLTPRLRSAMAKAVMKLANTEHLTDIEMGRLFNTDQAEILRQALIDAGIDENTIADVLHAVKKPEAGRGSMTEARRRIDFDESYTEAAIDKDGNEFALNFQDLLENNQMKLWSRYARHLEGHINMNEVYRVHSPVDGPPIRTIDGLLMKVVRDGKAFGQTDAEIAADIKRIKMLARHTLGIPQEKGVGPELANFLQDMRAVQYMRVFGLAGFSHIANYGSAMAATHFETWMNVFPRIARVIKDVTAGHEISEPLARQLRAIAVIRSEREVGQITGVLSKDKTSAGFYNKIRQGLRNGARVFGNVSGLLPMIHAQQEIFAIAVAEEWATIARSGKLPSKLRLAAMTLDESDAQKIIDAMRQHVTTRDTDMGGPIHDLNLDKWDPEARALFANSIDKMTRNWTLSGDPGQTAVWMDGELGKTLLQGRFVHAIGWDKRVRSSLRIMDPQAGAAIAMEMAIGGAAYALREQAASVGKKDREQYLKERLSPENIAKAAFAKNGFTSLFPIPVDSVARATGLYPKQFSYSRATGLEQDPVFGNPSLDFATRMMGPIPNSFVSLVHPNRKYTQTDMENGRMLIPGQNLLGMKNFLDYIESRLPKQHKEQP